MNIFLKSILIFLLIVLSACTWNTISNHATPVWPSYYVVEAKHGFEIVYDPQATHSVKEYYESGTFILNGSYFWTTASGWYYPAGLWRHPTKSCCTFSLDTGSPIPSGLNLDDPNLAYVVWVSIDNSVTIIPRESFQESTGSYRYTFQAGPLVLSGNMLQAFPHSWHANESHERTLMGKTDSGRIYFFVFTEPKTLSEVGKSIQTEFSHDPITLINLDGWPSTAYYDGTYGFRENENLPIILRVWR